MANEPNTPDHRWYERRNNIALSNEDLSRETIFDSGIQKINSWINSQPWGFDYPQLVLDFDDEYFRVDGGDTTFANAITHTRASTATYVDSTGTLQTAAINEPRLGHHVWNGTAWVNEGLLHESEARTNLLTYSEEFDNAYWSKDGVSIQANVTAAPDGALTADKIVENTASSLHQINRFKAASIGASEFTVSVFLKEAGRRYIRIDLTPNVPNDFSNNASAVLDLQTGTVFSETRANAQIQDFGGGWYRCSVTSTQATSSASTHIQPLFYLLDDSQNTSYTGDGTSGVFLWGAQLEAAPTVSSYIPTNSGTTVTRSADVLTIPAANLPYPEPVVIGPELVTNGTFDTNIDGWTAASGSVASWVDGKLEVVRSSLSNVSSTGFATTVGKTYLITAEITGDGGRVSVSGRGDVLSASGSAVFVAAVATTLVAVRAPFDGATALFDNISVREINPLALSIQMDGRVTYADTDSFTQFRPFSWSSAFNTFVDIRVDTFGARTGAVTAVTAISGTQAVSRLDAPQYSAGVFVPLNVGGRFTSTQVQAGKDGVTSTTSAHSLFPDLSQGNLTFGQTYNGTIRTFRMWGQDIQNQGLVEATS